LDPDRRARSAHAHSVEIRRDIDRLTGPQLPLSLPPVEGEDLQTRAVMQLLRPAFEERRGDDLADARIAGGEIGRAEHAELVLIDGEPSAVDDDRHWRAGTGLLEHILVGPELG